MDVKLAHRDGKCGKCAQSTPGNDFLPRIDDSLLHQLHNGEANESFSFVIDLLAKLLGDAIPALKATKFKSLDGSYHFLPCRLGNIS
ncbi:hypothetical protein OUZ56_011057 [Daphnia magna]|uniref:Uncharacterized protein n=1 Tax=Daphnia magna TaxID=35525 RepID=A0ABQ9YZ72_9CRUS|nr:hypothetical protein OUZ56_011057 [Daphnia magna]